MLSLSLMAKQDNFFGYIIKASLHVTICQPDSMEENYTCILTPNLGQIHEIKNQPSLETAMSIKLHV